MTKPVIRISNIDSLLWLQFKAKCALLSIPAGQRINQLIEQDIKIAPTMDEIIQGEYDEKIRRLKKRNTRSMAIGKQWIGAANPPPPLSKRKPATKEPTGKQLMQTWTGPAYKPPKLDR